MNIVTKNHSLNNGVRSYLVYLMNEGNALECYDVVGEDERIKKENELSEKNSLSTDDITYMSLEEFKTQELPTENPLFLVFYLSRDTWQSPDVIRTYGESVRTYLEEKGDNVRLFFMPTDDSERIECINPLFIENKDDIEKLDTLIDELEEKFSVGDE